MHVAVVIVGFRNPDDLSQCLKALARSTYPDFEVAICENGGPEAHLALQSVLPVMLPGGQPVRIAAATANLGYAGGVNIGMAMCPGADAWWVLNPDTQPEPEAMAACVARLAVGDCEAVGATLFLPDARVQCHGGVWQWLMARAVALGQGEELGAPVDAAEIERRQSYLSGASMLIGRRFLETVGPMREDYFLYCEEVEWFLRAQPLGMRLGFAPTARVRHEAGATTGSHEVFSRMPRTPVYLNERNKILVTRDLRPFLLPFVTISAIIVILLRYGRRGAWRQVGYAINGWFAGVLDRRGSPNWIASKPY